MGSCDSVECGDEDAASDNGRHLSCVAMGLASIALVPGLAEILDLRTLNLHGNRLSSLEGLGLLTALQELVLSSNALPAIGCSLSGLTNLRCLDLTSNNLTAVDGLSGLAALQHLVRLECGKPCA